MVRFMIVCFVFLGFAFYYLSDGAEFVPASHQIESSDIASAPLDSAQPADSATAPVVLASAASAPAVIPASAKPAAPAAVQAAAPVTEPVKIKASPAASATQFVALAAPAIVAQQEKTGAGQTPALDIRKVTGNRVNMRNGPGTTFTVVAKLRKGTEVEILREPGNGWVKLKVLDNDRVGWMADWLVTADAG